MKKATMLGPTRVAIAGTVSSVMVTVLLSVLSGCSTGRAGGAGRLAGAFYDSQRSLDAVERQIPAIARAADAAAEVYVAMQGLYAVRTVGDPFAGRELRVRAGGLADMVDEDTPIGQGEGGVVLAFLDESSSHAAADMLDRLGAEQSVVVGFGREDVLDAWRRDGRRLDHAITNGLPHWGFDREGREGGAVERMAQAVALWTWNAEFASACGRRGMAPRWLDRSDSPTFWIDSVLGTNRVRSPVRARAGVLGRRYVADVRERLDGLAKSARASVACAALVLARADQAGGRIHVVSPWPAVMSQALGVAAVPHDGGAFAAGQDSTLRPAPGEVVVVVDSAIPSVVADEWRRRGALLIWIASWSERGRIEAAPGDLAIDLPLTPDDGAAREGRPRSAISPANTVLALAALGLVHDGVTGLKESWIPPPSHLHAAVAGRDLPRVNLLAGSQIELNSRDLLARTPLFSAVLAGDLEMATRLVRSGADVSLSDVCGASPLHAAAELGDTGLAGMLVVAGAAVDARDRYSRTPLEIAAERGHAPMVELLMLNLASVKARNCFWETPLHAAARSGSAEAVSRLLAAGGAADARSNAGLSPLHWAARLNRGDVILVLAGNGTRWDIGDVHGMTPLHWAAHEAGAAAVKALLTTGADPNAPDRGGFTPLHYVVCRSGRGVPDSAEAILVTRLLVEAGADIWHAGGGGLTPLAAAQRVAGGVSRELLAILNSPGQPARADWGEAAPAAPAPEPGGDAEAAGDARREEAPAPTASASPPAAPVPNRPDEALSPLPLPDEMAAP